MLTVGGGFGVQFALLASGVIVARLLGVEDRGHLALLWVVALAIAFVGATGLPSSITYSVARDPSGSRPLARLMVKVGAIQSLVAVLVQALVLAIAIDDYDGSVQFAALISLVTVPSMIAIMNGMAFLQGLERFRPWTIVRLLPALLYTLAVAALAVTGTADLVTVTAAWAGANILAALAAIWSASKALPSEGSDAKQPSFTELQRFGGKAFLGSASPSDTLQIDQIFVGLFLSPIALGLYVVALALTNLPRILAQSVGYVVYPLVARQPTPREARRSMWLSTTITALGIGAVVGVLELSAGWLVPLFFGEAFDGAVELTRILLVAAFFVSVRRVLSDGARGAGYPGLGTVAELSSAAILLPTMAVMAGTTGASGVAWALAIAGAVGLATLLIALFWNAPRSVSQRAPVTAVGAEPAGDPALMGEAPR